MGRKYMMLFIRNKSCTKSKGQSAAKTFLLLSGQVQADGRSGA